MNADYNLVSPGPNSNVYVLHRRRFYVLGVFSFLSFNQCAFWIPFSPVSPSTQIYYGIPSTTVDLLLNWGPIVFISCLPLAYLLLRRRNGFRHLVIITAPVHKNWTGHQLQFTRIELVTSSSSQELNWSPTPVHKNWTGHQLQFTRTELLTSSSSHELNWSLVQFIWTGAERFAMRTLIYITDVDC